MKYSIINKTTEYRLRLTLVFCCLLLNTAYLKAQNQNTASWYDYNAVAVALGLQEGSWMADIGTRDGSYLNYFITHLGDSGHIFAVDIDTDGLDRLHQNINRWSYNNISTIYSIETNPMLPAKSLDAVYIRNAYHEFDEPELMLKHLKTALKPNGRLVISESMREGTKNRERSAQERAHVLDIEYAIKDLEETGFIIIDANHNFAQSPNDRFFYWLIIATPSEKN